MLASRLGWTLEYIRREMDIPQLQAFHRHWHAFPPVEVQLRRFAAYIGYTPEAPAGEQPPPGQMSAETESFLASLPTGGPPLEYISAEEYLRRKAEAASRGGR